MKSIPNFIIYLLIFMAGIFLSYFIISNSKRDSQTEASHTIAYGIKRLNKMVVAEQQYANFYSHKSKKSYLGNLVSFDKNVLLKVEVLAQASYNLNDLVVEIDSVNKIVRIQKVPHLEIKTFPDVEFFEMGQSTLNQFNTEDLNGIKKRAVQEVSKTIDMSSLKAEAHEQLLFNLEEIYILAKIYNWEIQDNTPYAQELRQKVKL